MLDCTVGFFVVVGTSAPFRRRDWSPDCGCKAPGLWTRRLRLSSSFLLPQPLRPLALSTPLSSSFTTDFDLTRFFHPASLHALDSGDQWLLCPTPSVVCISTQLHWLPANTVMSLFPRAMTISSLPWLRRFFAVGDALFNNV
jgi:hypothetical protein